MKTHYLALILTAPFISLTITSQSVINGYAQVSGTGGSTITVTNVDETFDTFEDGEQVIIMQMQDNVIGTTTNSINFGDVGSILSAGQYEVMTIASHTENGMGIPVNFTFTDPLSITFNTGVNTSVQIISFPEFGAPNYTTTADYTAKSWDGSTGGIIAFQVPGVLTLANSIDADGKGFRGAGPDKNQSCGGGVCESTTYISQWTTRAMKGEGIYKNTNPNFDAARGRILNGGGGGSCHNGAGGGGSNFSTGGDGGEGWGCKYTGNSAGGFGGLALGPYMNAGRIFMGGGGGAGERNNGWNTSGGNGGGIILIKAMEITTAGSCGGLSITANGETTPDIGNDGAGGAGAGGTILFEVANWTVSPTCSIAVESIGGNGGSSLSGGIHGGGGGGGQGAIIYSNKAPSSGVTNTTISGSGGCGNTSVPCNALADPGGGVPNGGVIGIGGSPLPVDLIYFNAIAEEGKVHISWQTAAEMNSDYFQVEKMNEYGDWYSIGELQAAGNSSSPLIYNLYDYNPVVGDNHYRLIQFDFNGDYKVYDPKTVRIADSQLGDVVIYPNPTKGIVNLSIADHIELNEIVLFDMSGKMIRTIPVIKQEQFEIDLSDLPKGIYFVKVNEEIKKLILAN